MKSILSVVVAAACVMSGVAQAADAKKPEMPASAQHKMHHKKMAAKHHMKTMKKHAEKAASK